ncbi:hypothetical protein BJ742DRAFT_743515 [Cladochytrium replicatum]|nr:hypothetical protein BJ742DRAFT_743515 [Cladochytrium replicatum]
MQAETGDEGEKTDNVAENGKKRNGVFNNGKPYCEQYAAHGYCNAGKSCSRPRDLDVILDHELGASSRNSKRPKHSTSAPERIPVPAPPSRLPLSVPHPALPTAPVDFESYHAATFDAFMTGYIFAHQINTVEKWQEHKNRVSLMGKQIPLRIERRAFTKGSADHRKKMEALLAANRRESRNLMKEVPAAMISSLTICQFLVILVGFRIQIPLASPQARVFQATSSDGLLPSGTNNDQPETDEPVLSNLQHFTWDLES